MQKMINKPKPEEQETIFSEFANTQIQKRNIKINRALIYLIAAWWLGWSIVYFTRTYRPQDSPYKYNQHLSSFLMTEYAIIGMIFLTLAISSHKKITMAYLIAFIFYGIVSFWFIYIKSFHFPNDLVRIFILILLVKGYEDAREYEQAKRSF